MIESEPLDASDLALLELMFQDPCGFDDLDPEAGAARQAGLRLIRELREARDEVTNLRSALPHAR